MTGTYLKFPQKYIPILFFIFLPNLTWGQFYFGSDLGVNISDAQDQKFISYDKNNKLLQKILVNDVEGALSISYDFNITYWVNDKVLHNYGIRFDCSDWTYNTFVEDFSTNVTPPINNIRQERTSYTMTLLRRFLLSNEINNNKSSNNFIYFGIGGGIVHSEVKYGADNIGKMFHILSGFALPVNNKFLLVGEFKYIITPDVDATPKPGWQVHTSGTKTPFRFGPHLDTRFFGFTVGFLYQIL